MKRIEKGFTLIELLAVIVILAIIALITVPIIINVIYKAEKGAFEDSAYGVVDAGRLYYADKLADTNSFAGQAFTFPNDIKDLKLSGEKPGGGTLILDGEGKSTLAITDSKKRWCALKAIDEEKIKIENYKGSSCDSTPRPTPTPTPVPTPKPTPAPDEEISITENKTIYVPKGGTVLLKITGATKYTSNNISIASVDQTGYVKLSVGAVSGSTINITINAPGKIVTVKVIVTPRIDNDFYMIYNKEDMEWFEIETSAKTIPVKNAKLMNDIDLLGNESNQWMPIKSFQGIFDGQNHSIKNLYINKPNVTTGLALFAGGMGTIKNVTVEGSITGKTNVAGIIGTSNGTVDNCINKANIAGENNIGGIISGSLRGTVRNSKNYGNITASLKAGGGIAGNICGSNVKLEGNSNYGVIKSYQSSGGIVGAVWNSSGITIQNNVNNGNVILNGSEAGGIIGIIYATNNVVIKQNSNKSSISASNMVGGIIGYVRSDATVITLTSNTNTGILTGNSNKGNIIGLNQSSSCTIN